MFRLPNSKNCWNWSYFLSFVVEILLDLQIVGPTKDVKVAPINGWKVRPTPTVFNCWGSKIVVLQHFSPTKVKKDCSRVNGSNGSEICRTLRIQVGCTHATTTKNHDNALLWSLQKAIYILKFASQKIGRNFFPILCTGNFNNAAYIMDFLCRISL